MKKTYALLLAVLAAVAFLVSGFSLPKNSAPATGADTLTPLPVFYARDHKGKSVVSNQGLVSFTSGLHNDFYPVDSLNKTGYLYIETKLQAFINDRVKRVPLNISIVIDRSGSMQGIKMGNAKKAAKAIIDQLSPNDFVSVVMYDNIVDSVQVPVRAIDRESIKKKIDGITARSATNLWGGTEKGFEYVQRNYLPGYINRVLLISDGLANAGITDSALIRMKVQQFKDDYGITLSTFGVGLDYNETLMTDMAETGQGNYYFIDDPAAMSGIFEKEINGLMKVAAQNAELRIRIPQGITIIKGYPLKYQQQGDEITVKYRDLFSEETKGMLFQFRIADGMNTTLKFTSTLQFTDVVDGQQKTITHVNELKPDRQANDYLVHFNKQVIEQAVLLTANENLERAMLQVDRGDYNGASQTLRANAAYLKANAVYAGADDYARLDSVNASYAEVVVNAKNLSADSVKRIQKSNKAVNYKIRNKKQ